jgi:hypothetical protein
MCDSEEFPIKMIESKSYIRLTEEGEPQLIRVGPAVNDQGLVNLSSASVYLDEGEPYVISKGLVESILSTLGCVPLEAVTHWKHTRIN